MIVRCRSCGQDKPLTDIHSFDWKMAGDIAVADECGRLLMEYLCKACKNKEEQQ